MFLQLYHYQVCGFSEFDTFRSNQVRQGIISREALELVRKENIPRFESILEYSQIIGFDLIAQWLSLTKLNVFIRYSYSNLIGNSCNNYMN